MALSFKQSTTGGSTTTSPIASTAFGSAVTAGNLIVVTTADTSGATNGVTNVTDTGGNTYTQIMDTHGTNGFQMWYAVVATGGSSFQVSVTWDTGFTSKIEFVAQEFQGFTGTPTLDVSHFAPASGGTTSTAPNSGATATTSQANELVVGGAQHSGSTSAFSLGTGYTNLGTVNSASCAVAQESKVVSSTGTQTAAFTIAASREWICGVATFYDASFPAIGTLSDNFNDNSIDGTKWASFHTGTSSIAETGGEAVATPGSSTATVGYAGYTSLNSYDLTGDAAYIKVATNVNAAAGAQSYFKLSKDSSNVVQWIYENGTLKPQKTVAGTTSDITAGVTYNSTTHAWWRIRESSGTTFFDYSSDGSSWTNHTSLSNPFTITAVKVEFAAGTYQSVASPGAAHYDNFNTPGSTAYTQPLTASMTPTGAFTKQARKPLTGSLPLSGVLAKKAIRAFTASMMPSGVLAKKTIRGLTGSLGLSGILTASHVVIKSLTASMTPVGTLTRRAGKALSGSLPLSGVLSKRTKHSFTAAMTPVGALAKKTARSLSGSMTPSGLITGTAHKFTKALTGAMTPVGVLARKTNKALSGSLPLSGVLNKFTSKHLSGSLTPSGSLATLKAYFRAFTASMTPTGTLSRKTNKGLSASVSFVGAFRVFIPPVFTLLSRVLNTFRASATEQTVAETARVETDNQIAELNTSDTIGIANSSSTSGTLQDENSSGTVETNNTNKTLD